MPQDKHDVGRVRRIIRSHDDNVLVMAEVVSQSFGDIAGRQWTPEGVESLLDISLQMVNFEKELSTR